MKLSPTTWLKLIPAYLIIATLLAAAVLAFEQVPLLHKPTSNKIAVAVHQEDPLPPQAISASLSPQPKAAPIVKHPTTTRSPSTPNPTPTAPKPPLFQVHVQTIQAAEPDHKPSDNKLQGNAQHTDNHPDNSRQPEL